MIELKYIIPFHFCDVDGSRLSESLSSAEIQKCLWGDSWFLEDLNNYFYEGDNYGVKAILPQAIGHDNVGYYVDMRVYSDAKSLSDSDIESISNYIEGQVSDGWGENGFELFDGLWISLDWKGISHNGSKFITDSEFEDVFKSFNGKRYKAEKPVAQASTAKDPLLDLINETIENLTKLASVLEELKG